MRNKLIVIIGLIIGLLGVSASGAAENNSAKPPDTKITVAVYPIKMLTSDKSLESLGPVLTSFLVTKLAKSSKLKVTEQEMTAEVEKQLEFANSDKCDSTMCPIPEIGKAMAAQKLVVGQVAKLGQKYTADVRVIDIEKKVIDFSVEEPLVCKEEDLDQLMELVALDVREKYGEKVDRPHFAGQAQTMSPSVASQNYSAASPDSQNLLGIVVADDLSSGEKRNYVGGVRVKSVSPDSPCKNILAAGNVITFINPQGAVPNPPGRGGAYHIENLADFSKLVSSIKPGASVGIGTYPGKSTFEFLHSSNCLIPAQPQTYSQPSTPAPSEPGRRAVRKRSGG